MLNKIDHIGIAVNDLQAAMKTYESFLGLKCLRTEEIPSEQVIAAFLEIDNVAIELLQPIGNEGTLIRFLHDRGEGIHHIAFETTDIDLQLKDAEAAGCQLIRGLPQKGAREKNIAFLHPHSTHGVLIEFCSALKIHT